MPGVTQPSPRGLTPRQWMDAAAAVLIVLGLGVVVAALFSVAPAAGWTAVGVLAVGGGVLIGLER